MAARGVTGIDTPSRPRSDAARRRSRAWRRAAGGRAIRWWFIGALPWLALGASAANESPVVLSTASGLLRGTLALPNGAAPWPVLLLVAGSGPTDRDGNAAGAGAKNDALKLLATALADAGIASVRYDKRGVGESAAAAPAESDLRFDTYVRDAADWVRLLTADPRFRLVGVVGHSEGATIGLLAAAQAPVELYVSVAGPGAAAADLLRKQLAGRLTATLAVHNEAILQALEQGRMDPEVPTELAALYRTSVQPYLVSWFSISPTDAIARLHVPCLVVQGDTDIQVGVADARALGRAQPNCEVAIVPGMNHVLKLVPPLRARQIESYGDAALPVAPELVRRLTRFVTAAAGAK